MPSIGSENFDVLQGINTMSPIRWRVEDVTKRGDDGHWLTKVGKRSDPFEMIGTVGVASAALAKTKINTTYPALLVGNSGALVTVTD